MLAPTKKKRKVQVQTIVEQKSHLGQLVAYLLGVEALVSGGVIKMPMAGIHEVQLWEVFFELD